MEAFGCLVLFLVFIAVFALGIDGLLFVLGILGVILLFAFLVALIKGDRYAD